MWKHRRNEPQKVIHKDRERDHEAKEQANFENEIETTGRGIVKNGLVEWFDKNIEDGWMNEIAADRAN